MTLTSVTITLTLRTMMSVTLTSSGPCFGFFLLPFICDKENTKRHTGRELNIIQINNYFELKISWGCCPNSNYSLSSVASQATACQSKTTTYAHTASMSTCSFTQAWAHRHRHTVDTFFFPRILPHLELYQTIWLVMYMLYRSACLLCMFVDAFMRFPVL